MRRDYVFLTTVCFTTLGLLLASCAPAAPLPTAAPLAETPASKPLAASPTPKPATEEPRYGGILNTTMNADMPSFDVHQEPGLLTQATVQSCYSGLVQNKPSDPDKIIGDLAEKWDVSPDGTVYTFYLHKGVKFHDGSTLTADDVKLSLERIYDPPRGVVSPRKGTLSAIKQVGKRPTKTRSR